MNSNSNLIRLILLLLSFGCVGCSEEPSWGPSWMHCDSAGEPLDPNQPTPFGPTAIEVADSLSSAISSLSWDFRNALPPSDSDFDSGRAEHGVDGIRISLRLHPTRADGGTAVGYMPKGWVETSQCLQHPGDGLRLNLLVYIDNADGSLSAVGTIVALLAGPDLNRATIRFLPESIGHPLRASTNDPELVRLATVDGAVSPENEDVSTIRATLYGRQGGGPDWTDGGAFLFLYSNDSHYEELKHFARANLRINWLSDPLWDEGSTP